MRVKVGSKWYESEPGQPIMVELTPTDKKNINDMSHDATRYALFADDDTTSEQKRAWMGDDRP